MSSVCVLCPVGQWPQWWHRLSRVTSSGTLSQIRRKTACPTNAVVCVLVEMVAILEDSDGWHATAGAVLRGKVCTRGDPVGPTFHLSHGRGLQVPAALTGFIQGTVGSTLTSTHASDFLLPVPRAPGARILIWHPCLSNQM